MCTVGALSGYAGSTWGGGGVVATVLAAGFWARAAGGLAPGRLLWGVLTVGVAIRVVIAVGEARAVAGAWTSLAESGTEVEVRATVVVVTTIPGRGGAWSVQGRAAHCAPVVCSGATLSWRWEGEEPPRAGERWRLSGRLAFEPIDTASGRYYPPPGLAVGARRGRLGDPVVLDRRHRAVPILAAVEGHLRDRIEARFDRADAALVLALLLGDRSRLDAGLRDAFATAGALHLLAVSGLHVGFLAWLLVVLLRMAGFDPVRRAAIVSLVLTGYAALVGARPSVVRASIMVVAVLWSHATERRVSTWHIVGLAAMVILVWRPLDLFDLGFSLSFGAVAGLLYWGSVRGIEVPRSGGVAGAGYVAHVLARSTVVTTAATLGTMPVVASAFGWFAPGGFVVNPVAIPLVGVALPLAWITLGWDAIGLDPAAVPLAASVSMLTGSLRWIVAETGIRVGVWVPGQGVGIGLPLVIGAIAIARRSLRWSSAALILALSLALTVDRKPPGLEIVWLDVGQGDAIVLRFPNGATWLIDSGPSYPGGDSGHHVVIPYLRRAGVSRLSWLITTHPDLDHVGGAASVARSIEVDRWGSTGAVGFSTAYLALLSSPGPRRAERLLAGRRLREGEAAVDVLHPPAGWISQDPALGGSSANEGSIVLLVRYRQCRGLLTGDAGRESENRLVDVLGDSLNAELLHIGHHGSRHSTTERFVEAVRPSFAVVSVGRLNRHGHPHADVLARLERHDVQAYRTDRSGTVTARCVADGWRLQS